MSLKNYSVHAILVSYNPDQLVLASALRQTIEQVDKVWLVDNASKCSPEKWISELGLGDSVTLIPMTSNRGVGAAQNVGLSLARQQGASHALLLDQDSIPDSGMVCTLVNACEDLQTDGVRVAAVAPLYKDSLTGLTKDFIRLGWFDFRISFERNSNGLQELGFVISSGSLIPLSVLDVTGLMDESLFIDYVDTEWCLRAQSKGYRLFGVSGASMTHSLGDRRLSVGPFRKSSVAFHSPFRYYYIARNSLNLIQRPYIPLRWRVGEGLRLLTKIVFYSLVGGGRMARLKMILIGLRDGIKGVTGRLSKRV